MTGAKSDDFAAKWIAAAAPWSEAEQVPLGYARPSGTLAAEENFSDVHAAGKMIKLIRRLRAANSARLLSGGKIKGLFILFPAALVQ